MLKSATHIFFIIFLFGLIFGAPVPAQDRFIDNGNGTVTDSRLGVMWAQTDNQNDIFWKQANKWIQGSFAGSLDRKYGNWRLPTIVELQSLYREDPDYQGYQAACGYVVKMVPQITISCILVWSSDTALGLPLAFNYYLGNALTVDLYENTGCRVLAVRNVK
ncbi:MAG: DUF1566 domain-containing protein [Desulfobacterales bacterium]|nr:MAG: DUF1566 domain-containing protein [Desulfobacterales bacterium]